MTVWYSEPECYCGKVTCANCGVERGCSGGSPLECIRALYSEGWRCFFGGDLCPTCTDLLYSSHVNTLRPGFNGNPAAVDPKTPSPGNPQVAGDTGPGDTVNQPQPDNESRP